MAANTNDAPFFIVGVAGPSGSGKSVLAKNIINELGSDKVEVISEDSYYKDRKHLSMEERNKINYDHPDAFDHDLLVEQLDALREGRGVDVPIYDYAIHARSDQVRHVQAGQNIVVVEGILILSSPELRDRFDIKIYVDTPLDLCFIRRLERDVQERGRSMQSVLNQYRETVRPMFIKYIEPTRSYSDIIVPHGGLNQIAVDMIRARFKELLRQTR